LAQGKNKETHHDQASSPRKRANHFARGDVTLDAKDCPLADAPLPKGDPKKVERNQPQQRRAIDRNVPYKIPDGLQHSLSLSPLKR
jgi:hypothetical protein